MSSRNNEDRFGAPNPDTDAPLELTEETPSSSPLNFVVPTEFVDLPSRGEFYPTSHPLSGESQVEIKFLTAKDEDILTSKSLLQKGIALDRMIQNILVNKKVRVEDLLTGDKNAILIAARASGYGSEYETSITCPSCTASDKRTYNLEDCIVTNGLDEETTTLSGVTLTNAGTFNCTLPKSGISLELRLLTGRDEHNLIQLAEKRRKKKQQDHMITDQFKQMVVGVNGHTDRTTIEAFVDTMTLMDTRYLREVYDEITPNITMESEYVCSECGYEDTITFPVTTDFFWPQR
tara:strand:+ start:10615 stop:11487 length:873 start_codon:yes stop_codon:yes gene_type:complete